MQRQQLIIGTLDAKWRVQGISGDVAEILGYQPEDCLGVKVLDAIHPADHPAALSLMGLLANDETPASVLLRLRRNRWGWREIEVAVRPFVSALPRPFVFLLTPVESPLQLEALDRLRNLEFHLRRIAAEARAAGIAVFPSVAASQRDLEILAELTPRQHEILERLMAGLRGPDIARDLFLSQTTVRNHLAAIFRKFDVHSQSELIKRLNEAPPGPRGEAHEARPHGPEPGDAPAFNNSPRESGRGVD